MAKSASDAVLDGSLDIVATSTQLTVCETEPTTYEEANSAKGTGAGKVLARVVVSGVDFTKQAGAASARELVVAQKAGLSIEQTGNGDHVALTTTGNTSLDFVTTAPTKTLTAGGTVDVETWKITQPQPT